MLSHAKVRDAVEQALRARRHHSARAVAGISFHMTDWLDDLSRFHAFCVAPRRFAPRVFRRRTPAVAGADTG